jgi:ribonuclease P protein component
MKKTEMLKKNYQFRKVLSKGEFFREKEIEIFVLKNKLNINLLGIAIGTKNGKSFQRNKAKRIIRESYRKLEPQMNVGNSIVILIKKGTDLNNIKFNNIFESLKYCFNKAKIIKEEE